MSDLPLYADAGARALVILHERHLREFLATWTRAKAAGLDLPATDDPSYASLEALLRHVMRAARGYMTWCCEKLDLPDPKIDATPGDDAIEAAASQYLEHVVERWRTPLAGVTEQQTNQVTYAARWGPDYCVDAMLEHAVMHPIRHTYQLEALMAAR